MRFPGDDVRALLAGGATLHTGLFVTDVGDASVVPIFARATLAGGSVVANNLVIEEVLDKESDFIGQDIDSAPFYFDDPEDLSEEILEDLDECKYDDLDECEYEDLVLILELPYEPFPGVSGFSPLIGLDVGPPLGNSFISDDGGETFTPVTNFNFVFDLVATP